MEWVETTGKTIDEAKGRALDQLGVDEADAEFEVIEEPRPGLFGRLRGEARVRARVRPTTPRPKVDRRDRKRSSRAEGGAPSTEADRPRPSGGRRKAASRAETASDERADTLDADALDADLRDADAPSGDALETVATVHASSSGPPTSANSRRRRRGRRGGARSTDRPAASPNGTTDTHDDPYNRDDQDDDELDTSKEHAMSGQIDAAQVGDEAAVFLRGLVSAFGLEGTVAVATEGDEIDITVDGNDLGLLVGPRGSTLQAVQDLTRVAAQRRLGDHDTRLRVDVGGYRARRKEALGRFALQIADQVVAEQRAKRLEPMGSSDRKIVHDALSDRSDVSTRSEGDDPNRFVVIAPVEA
jgi:spoIIIJ-associated protein